MGLSKRGRKQFRQKTQHELSESLPYSQDIFFFFFNRERIYSGVWRYLANVVGVEAVKGVYSQIVNVIH